MPRRSSWILAAALAVGLLALPALSSGQVLPNAKLALHAVPDPGPGSYCGSPVDPGCGGANSGLNTNVNLGNALVYVIAVDLSPGNGFAGASYGIAYDAGISVMSWESCSDLQFLGNGWPASGGGNVQTYNTNGNCQFTESVVIGAFRINAPVSGLFALTERSWIAVPKAEIADCTAASRSLIVPDQLGAIGFGQEGYDPCLGMVVPIEETTWGRIKSTWGDRP